MRIDLLLEAEHALHAGLRRLEVEHEHLPARLPDQVDHRVASQGAPLEVVGRDVGDHLGVGVGALEVAGEHRDACGVRLADGGTDRLRVHGGEHDRLHLESDPVLDLAALDADVLVAAEDLNLVAVLLGLGGQVVGDDLEERVVRVLHREPDPALGLRRGVQARVARAVLGRLARVLLATLSRAVLAGVARTSAGADPEENGEAGGEEEEAVSHVTLSWRRASYDGSR